MRPLNFTAAITRTKRAIHYALSAVTILLALATIACLIAATTTPMGSVATQGAVACGLSLIGIIGLGHKLQERGILEDPSRY